MQIVDASQVSEFAGVVRLDNRRRKVTVAGSDKAADLAGGAVDLAGNVARVIDFSAERSKRPREENRKS
jgi:hypothetical protein